ncbi:MAG: transposase [Anaerolineae bacterium]
MDERELWAMLVRIRWPKGAVCPHCGERDPQYLTLIGPDYRGGLGRWCCRVCAEAGDPGEGGTFTPLTGTILDGVQIGIRTLWLVVELFADGKASVETAKEGRVNRHTTDRLFRLLRAAIYQTRSLEPIVLTPEAIAKFDEVYLTAGLKGRAGGLQLEREPRKRRLKRRGRGTWDSDRLPVFLDLDGDGISEVHCNTMECTWSWLRQVIRTYRGVSKVYLPLYVARFEFLFNCRHKNRWNRTLDVLQAAFQVEATGAADLLACVESARFAEVCSVAG